MSPEQVFDDHQKAVYRFVYRLVGRANLAEDITQDCFMAILRHPQRYDADRFCGITTRSPTFTSSVVDSCTCCPCSAVADESLAPAGN